MLRHAARLLLLAPALTFGLGAVFVLSARRLAAFPGDPGAWEAFLALSPLVREPVFLVADVGGMGDMFAFGVFALAALFGCALAFSPTSSGRSAFIYAHIAFLTLFYSMSGAGVFTAGNIFGDTGLASRLDWSVDFSGYPVAGIVLFCLVCISCAAMHLRILKRLVAHPPARRGNRGISPGSLR